MRTRVIDWLLADIAPQGGEPILRDRPLVVDNMTMLAVKLDQISAYAEDGSRQMLQDFADEAIDLADKVVVGIAELVTKAGPDVHGDECDGKV